MKMEEFLSGGVIIYELYFKIKEISYCILH